MYLAQVDRFTVGDCTELLDLMSMDKEQFFKDEYGHEESFECYADGITDQEIIETILSKYTNKSKYIHTLDYVDVNDGYFIINKYSVYDILELIGYKEVFKYFTQ